MLANGDNRGLALTTAIQEVGMPCLLAFDDRMVEYWCRVEQPNVAVVQIGATWTRRMSDLLIRRGMTVVALSDDEDERIAALGRGYQDALSTTLAPREVAARLRQRFLPLNESPGQALLAEGPLRMDLATRRVWWWDQERHLGPMQFDLLAYLAARVNTMVPIDALLRDVWREVWGGGYRNKVTKMIGRIRETLGEDCPGYVRSTPGYYGYITSVAASRPLDQPSPDDI